MHDVRDAYVIFCSIRTHKHNLISTVFYQPREPWWVQANFHQTKAHHLSRAKILKVHSWYPFPKLISLRLICVEYFSMTPVSVKTINVMKIWNSSHSFVISKWWLQMAMLELSSYMGLVWFEILYFIHKERTAVTGRSKKRDDTLSRSIYKRTPAIRDLCWHTGVNMHTYTLILCHLKVTSLNNLMWWILLQYKDWILSIFNTQTVFVWALYTAGVQWFFSFVILLRSAKAHDIVSDGPLCHRGMMQSYTFVNLYM